MRVAQRSAFADALDIRADALQLVLDALVAAIDVIDATDVRVSIGDQSSEDDRWPAEGRIVVRRAAGTVSDAAEFVRLDDGKPTGAGELYLYYRKRGGQTRIGTDAFYFEEGKADTYSGARYGELRVDSSGGSVLVGLCDENGKSL